MNPELNHLILTGIALEIGFNSKPLFNTTFKKLTGKTPSEFKKTCSDL
jgi:AraC-like DNA-binding protein